MKKTGAPCKTGPRYSGLYPICLLQYRRPGVVDAKLPIQVLESVLSTQSGIKRASRGLGCQLRAGGIDLYNDV